MGLVGGADPISQAQLPDPEGSLEERLHPDPELRTPHHPWPGTVPCMRTSSRRPPRVLLAVCTLPSARSKHFGVGGAAATALTTARAAQLSGVPAGRPRPQGGFPAAGPARGGHAQRPLQRVLCSQYGVSAAFTLHPAGSGSGPLGLGGFADCFDKPFPNAWRARSDPDRPIDACCLTASLD